MWFSQFYLNLWFLVGTMLQHSQEFKLHHLVCALNCSSVASETCCSDIPQTLFQRQEIVNSFMMSNCFIMVDAARLEIIRLNYRLDNNKP